MNFAIVVRRPQYLEVVPKGGSVLDEKGRTVHEEDRPLISFNDVIAAFPIISVGLSQLLANWEATVNTDHPLGLRCTSAIFEQYLIWDRFRQKPAVNDGG